MCVIKNSENRFLLAVFLVTLSLNIQAETIKIDSYCYQTTANSMTVHVPILVKYQNNSTYNNLLHLTCDEFNKCLGMKMSTNVNAKGINFFDVTLMQGLKRTVNRSGYNVFEWGINVFTIDFTNNKVTWNETGGTTTSRGSGQANCKSPF